MNDEQPGQNFWVTTDAGRTWQQTVSEEFESWSVYAMPNATRDAFCANESQPTLNLPYKTINLVNLDGGFTWSTRASFPTIHFTGTIDGAGKTLYFQTDTAIYATAIRIHVPARNVPLGRYRRNMAFRQWSIEQQGYAVCGYGMYGTSGLCV